MPQTVEEAIAAAQFISDGEAYALIKLPVNAIIPAAGIIAQMNTPFSTLILDKDEITLIVIVDAVADFENRLRDSIVYETRFRLITIDVQLDPQMVGFMAAISAALKDAGVSIMTYAAYSRDHLFVPVDQFDTAMTTLEALKS